MALTILDAGVIIGVLDADDAHHRGAREALMAALERGDSLVVPASAYAEALAAPARRGREATQALRRVPWGPAGRGRADHAPDRLPCSPVAGQARSSSPAA